MKRDAEFYNSVEAARMLNVNVSTIKRWTEDGTLECFKTAGGHRKFSMKQLVKYLTEHGSRTSKTNLFPIESDADLKLSSRIIKGDFEYLVEYVTEQALTCNRERVLRILSGLHAGQFPLHEIYDKLITSVLHKTGELWKNNDITVTEEHFASQTIRDCIIRLQGSIPLPQDLTGTVFCLIMSNELHDIAIKMVDHILEQRGFKILCSGQMTPSIRIEKVFELHRPDRVYISSTVAGDENLAQAEFDKICYVALDHGARVFVGGRGFDIIDFSHPAVERRLSTFQDVFTF